MLGEALELAGPPPNDFLNLPGSHILRFPCVEFFDQLRVALSQTASSTQRILFVNMLLVDVEEKELHEGLSVAEALQN